jgi:hypothetical protein
MNLLKETEEILAEHNKTWEDVKWVGCREFKIPIELFKKLADKEYNEDFGGTEVVKDLLVVGNDWWLERYEYDGSEWWVYKTVLKEPKITRDDIRKVIDNDSMCDNLEEINKERSW